MTKLSFWKLPSRNKKQQAPPEIPPTTLRRSNATKRRTAPIVAARESSLYRAAEPSAYRSVSDGFTASHPIDTLYHLQENPSLFFPSPPPRLSVHWDHRHTDIWDDLFDHAETCRPGWNRSDPYDQPSHRTDRVAFTCHSQLDLSEAAREKRTGLKESVLGLKGRFMRSEIWSSKTPEMSTPPSVPPRSRLRSQAPPTYLLEVDEPIPESTPSLSASSSSEHGSPPLVSPSDTIVFGRKKRPGLSQDPLRVKDGAEPRRSTSGVYTPTTFPGPQGPRPSHYPSHVYTPSNFSFHSTHPSYSSSGPSRSSSISSGDSDSPGTPSSRLSSFSGRAMTGLRRISQQIPKISPPPREHNISAANWAPKTPPSAHSAYSAHSPVLHPLSPVSPISPYSHGLGVGLAENNGHTSKPAVLFDDSENKTSPQTKTKRKPVPKILDDQVVAPMGSLEIKDTQAA